MDLIIIIPDSRLQVDIYNVRCMPHMSFFNGSGDVSFIVIQCFYLLKKSKRNKLQSVTNVKCVLLKIRKTNKILYKFLFRP